MFDLQAEAVEPPDKLDRRSGAATDDADGRVEFPAARIFLEGVEDRDPDGGDAAGDGDMFADHQFQNAFWVDVWAWENEARAEHGGGKGDAPGVGVKHRRDGQDGVSLAHAKNFDEAATKGMEHERAVRINHAFRAAGGAGSEAHGGAVVFVDCGILKFGAGAGE